MDAESLTVTLPPDMLRQVRDSVTTGEYASADDAMSDAIRIWNRQRRDRREHLDTIQMRIRSSLDDSSAALSDAELDAYLRTATGTD